VSCEHEWTTVSRIHVKALVISMTLAGCAFAPPETPPSPPNPVRYTAEAIPPTSVNGGGTVQQFAQGAPLVPEWWQFYQSPELDAWVAEGLRSNPSLDAARHTLELAHEEYRARAGARLPSVDGAAVGARIRSPSPLGPGQPPELFNLYAGQLTLSYTFDAFGAIRYGVKQAAAQVDLERYELDAARRTLAANIVITTIAAAALQEQVATLERLVALAQEQAFFTEGEYRAGAASLPDLLNVREEASSLEASLPRLRIKAVQARHALAVLMGRPPDQAPPALPFAELHLPQQVPISVPSDLLRQRPDVLAAEAWVRGASAQVGAATAELFPQITLFAAGGSAAFDSASLFSSASSMWSLGSGLTQPIFHGGALRAKRRAAIAAYEAAIAQYRQTVLNAFQNVGDTLAALDQDALTVRSAHDAAALASMTFADSEARYRLGALSHPLEVAGEQNWQNAKLLEIEATANRLTDTAALFQAMGDAPPIRHVADSFTPSQ
jgi:NodT family efflux transporter outer membrane factor (OMF) lipoprotein